MDTQLTTVMVPLTAGLVASSKWIVAAFVICSALVMSAKLLSSHGAQDITKVMGY
jgi:hypothetical protein